MMEMAMEGIATNAAYVAAILGGTLGASTFLLFQARDRRMRADFFKVAQAELDAAMISAERALMNGATPKVVRFALLAMLEAVATPEVGKSFTEHFITRYGRPVRARPGNPTDLSRTVDSLHVTHPELAADIHRAMMGLIMAIPVLYADKVTVDVFAISREGAANPESLLDRAMRALSRQNNGGPSGGTTEMGKLAAC